MSSRAWQAYQPLLTFLALLRGSAVLPGLVLARFALVLSGGIARSARLPIATVLRRKSNQTIQINPKKKKKKEDEIENKNVLQRAW